MTNSFESAPQKPLGRRLRRATARLAPALAGLTLGLPTTLGDASAALNKHTKGETPGTRMNKLAQKLGHDIVKLSHNPDVHTTYFHGHGQNGIGLNISVAETVTAPRQAPVVYDFGVTYGYKHGKVSRGNITELDFSATNYVVHGPFVDFSIVKPPQTKEWQLVATYSTVSTSAPPFRSFRGSPSGSFGKQLDLAEINMIEGQAEILLHEAATQNAHPAYLQPPK